MSSTVAVNYRSFRLPWTASEKEERLYRRIMAAVIGLFIAFGIVIPLLPTPPKPKVVEQPVPERIVELIARLDARERRESKAVETGE